MFIKNKYLIFVLLVSLLVTLSGCQNNTDINTELINANSPTLSLSTGTYIGSQTITITSDIENANIYYTLDNSTPTIHSSLYQGPIVITSTSILKAIVVKQGFIDSSVSEATYTILLESVGVIDLGDRLVIYFALDVQWVDVHFVVNQNNQQNVRMVKNPITQLYEITISSIVRGDSIVYGFTYMSGVAAKTIGWSLYYTGEEAQPLHDVTFTNSLISGVNHLIISIGFDTVATWVNVHYIFNFMTQQNLRLTLNNQNNRYEITIPNFTSSDSLAYSFTYLIGDGAVTTGWNIYNNNL
jgi:hypothetical protein